MEPGFEVTREISQKSSLWKNSLCFCSMFICRFFLIVGRLVDWDEFVCVGILLQTADL